MEARASMKHARIFAIVLFALATIALTAYSHADCAPQPPRVVINGTVDSFTVVTTIGVTTTTKTVLESKHVALTMTIVTPFAFPDTPPYRTRVGFVGSIVGSYALMDVGGPSTGSEVVVSVGDEVRVVAHFGDVNIGGGRGASLHVGDEGTSVLVK